MDVGAVIAIILIFCLLLFFVGLIINSNEKRKDKEEELKNRSNIKEPVITEYQISHPAQQTNKQTEYSDLANSYEMSISPESPGVIKQQPAIPPGMKECFQCKTLIRADALTCPQCGKDPNKLSAIGDQLSKLGCSMMMLPIWIIILAGCICLLVSLFSN